MSVMNLPGPKARAYIKRDQAVISPSYPRGYAFVMDHGQGTQVWDVDGNRFLDFAAGIAVVATGHSHPKVVKAIQEQAEKFIHISSDFYHARWIELAEKLNEIAPFLDNAVSFMTNSGTESVEAAIKLARHYTRRSQFIGFLGAFHGRTMGSVTFTASKPSYHRGFYPLLNGVVHVPFPDPYRPVLQMRPGEDYGQTVVRFIEEEIFGHLLPPEDVAGVLIEPIQGEGGYIVPPPGFFPALRELCDRHRLLLIVDEVQSGVGRTGKWWAIEHFDVEPDIVCIAKGIASGVPLGVMMAREHLMTWPKGSHGNTFGGNPLACAAALATLELIEEEYLENAAEMGRYTLDILEEIMGRHPSIGDVRGKGLMFGFELVKERSSKTPFDPHQRVSLRVEEAALKRGLVTYPCTGTVNGVAGDMMLLAPPLTITAEQINDILNILDDSLSEVEKDVL